MANCGPGLYPRPDPYRGPENQDLELAPGLLDMQLPIALTSGVPDVKY